MPTEAHAHTSSGLDLFREKVAAARRQTGRLQRELADSLAIDPQVLSRKLHGAKQTFPTHAEVKQIIKALAGWDAITTQDEAIELLSLMGLKAESFSDQEWNAAPLNRLEPAAHISTDSATSPTSAQYSHSPVPASSTSLIGRDYHVQLLLDRLRQASVRLLTLLGAGGVGKTRLALEVARAAQHDFADGVFFVSLATIRDAALVPSTIVQALHLSEPIAGGGPGSQGGSSHEDLLKRFLQEKKLLLVLDNVEQIPDIAPFISDLLSTVEALKVMVTSRAVLHLYGEHEFDVPPLEVCSEAVIPSLLSGQALSAAKDARLTGERSFAALRMTHLYGDAALNPDYVSQFPAIRLFVERAQAVNPAFQITEQNAATIALICAHLDGLPLAIELAAVRTKVLPLPMILQRLVGGAGRETESLTFLRSIAHNIPSRHQTLYHTLNWSYELLGPQQQCLFRRLGVFLGGWTLEAALAVCITEGPEEQPQESLADTSALGTINRPLRDDALQDDVLEQMESLMDQSLVKRIAREERPFAEDTEPRFHFLETIRDYALGQLEACGEREDIQRRHAAWYLALAERVEPDLAGREQSLAVTLLAREQDNLRAALLWAIEHNETEIVQRLCGALGMFWEARTQFQEAHRWIDAALNMPQATTPARGEILRFAQDDNHFPQDDNHLPQDDNRCAQDDNHFPQDDNASLRAGSESSEGMTNVTLSAAKGLVRAKLLMAASRLALWEIACERSRELAELALALYEEVGDVTGKTQAIFQIGDTWHMQGEYTQATRYLEENLPLLYEQENWRTYGFALSRLGAMALLQGNFPQAWRYLSEAVTLQREYSEPGLLNVTLVYLGVLAFMQGDAAQSIIYLREGLLLAQHTGNRYMLATDLTAFGCVLGAMRGPFYGAQICSAAEALFESLNTALPAAYRPLYDAYLSSFKSQIDEATWETWWAEGRALSQEEVITLALAASETGR